MEINQQCYYKNIFSISDILLSPPCDKIRLWYSHRETQLWGAIVGDALGVPVEFHSRAERKKNPVAGMRGEGTFNLPPGSWSDDSSLMLCTVEGLLDGFSTESIGRLFIRWLKDGYWTPFGYAFDVGYTTAKSVKRLEGGIEPELAGGTDERDNGNGSLPSLRQLILARIPIQQA